MNICENNQEKYLGVITSASMLWIDQIKTSISKANKMSCWIARNVILRDGKTMLAIYKALTRPLIIEYCVQLWNPVTEFGNWNLISTNRVISFWNKFPNNVKMSVSVN